MPSSSSVRDLKSACLRVRPKPHDIEITAEYFVVFLFFLFYHITHTHTHKYIRRHPSTLNGQPRLERLLPKPCNSLASNPASNGSRCRRFQLHLKLPTLLSPIYLSFRASGSSSIHCDPFTFLSLPFSTLLARVIVVLTWCHRHQCWPLPLLERLWILFTLIDST